MCMQCMATAMTAGAGVTGIRAWLATRGFCWLTPLRLRRITVGLFAAGLLASAVVITGSGAAPANGAGTASHLPAESR
jgi:hypothetical protein